MPTTLLRAFAGEQKRSACCVRGASKTIMDVGSDGRTRRWLKQVRGRVGDLCGGVWGLQFVVRVCATQRYAMLLLTIVKLVLPSRTKAVPRSMPLCKIWNGTWDGVS